MDFIKVLNKHVLFEYNDLSDSEFRAWVKIMSLTAFMESMPTREQMLKYVHYKTIDSLQYKLNKHSIDLQYVLNKVLIDAQCVVNKRNAWKERQKRKRELMKNVTGDVTGDVSPKRREEKRREEKIVKKEKIAFVLPEWIKKETWEAYREMRQRKRAPLTDRAAVLTLRELEKLRSTGQDPEAVLNQSIMKSWTGVFPISNGGTSYVKPSSPFADEKRTPLQTRIDAEADEITRRRRERMSACNHTTGNATTDDVPDFPLLSGRSEAAS